jgi:hypothetical protein
VSHRTQQNHSLYGSRQRRESALRSIGIPVCVPPA